MSLGAPLPRKKIHILNDLPTEQQKTPLHALFKELETKSLKIKMYQLPSIKLQDEPQLGKSFSAGMETDLGKLFKVI